jgi:hypothetical protein
MYKYTYTTSFWCQYENWDVRKTTTFTTVARYGSPKFIWAPCAQLYSLAETPQQAPPSPALELMYSTRALMVSQDRRHLFVTPCLP